MRPDGCPGVVFAVKSYCLPNLQAGSELSFDDFSEKGLCALARALPSVNLFCVFSA